MASFHIRVCISILAIIIAFDVRNSPADESSTRHAMSLVFGEEILSTNVLQIVRTTQQRSPEERFQLLFDWVLPSKHHQQIRLNSEFTSLTELTRNIDDTAGMPIAVCGKHLLSPALNLVEVAIATRRLDELRTQVLACQPTGEVQERCKLALLAIVEIHRGDGAQARKLIEALETRLDASTFGDIQSRWPETLVLTVAVEHSELWDICEVILNRILTRQIRAGTHCGPQQWDRHIANVAGRLRYLQGSHERSTAVQEYQSPPHLTDWIPVSECDESTRALGFPQAHWQLSGRQVDKLVSHQNDYLMYRMPLKGSFAIDCDTTCFGYKEFQLTIGGRWLSPHYTYDVFETGDLRGLKSQIPLDPKLSLVNDWVRHRAVVRDGVCSMYFNGRLMTTEPVRSQFPWIALRSPFFSNGSVKNVQITGTPEIPQTVQMSSDPEMSGWMRYHLDSVGGPADDWRFDASLGSEGGIFARQKSQYHDTFQESLLRYFRPMVENGVIAYEFYYEPGKFHVSPALDRQVYLITPTGISIHRVTDGVFDATGLDPLNRYDAGPRTECPLTIGWNQASFELADNKVKLSVNGLVVHSSDVEADNDRTFGLFHYADQSAVRVRNMLWTGEWSTRMRELEKQELRSRELDEVDARSIALKSRVVFDFSEAASKERNDPTAQPYSTQGFTFQAADNPGGVEQLRGGLQMTLPGSPAFKDVWVAPRVRVAGDFDILAEFDGLKMGDPVDGTRSIALIVVTEDELTTHSRVWHGVYAHPGIDRRRATQAEFNRYGAGRGVTVEFEGVTAEACDSGRLRVSRIGTRMYFMIAEQDSNVFRLIHKADVSDEQLRLDGIRLAAGTWNNEKPETGEVIVNWKRLEIRAEKTE
jgi:hypothetical protein